MIRAFLFKVLPKLKFWNIQRQVAFIFCGEIIIIWCVFSIARKVFGKRFEVSGMFANEFIAGKSV
jgi:hypothetical protein